MRVHGKCVQPGTERIWEWLAALPDPEMPFISLLDLGVIRDVHWQDSQLTVVITPTYSGCPAQAQIVNAIRLCLQDRGMEQVQIQTRLSPAWSSASISETGRARLRAANIAPPLPLEAGWQTLRYQPYQAAQPACPLCDASDTRVSSEFGSSLCKSLHVCNSCGNPFEYFKAI